MTDDKENLLLLPGASPLFFHLLSKLPHTFYLPLFATLSLTPKAAQGRSPNPGLLSYSSSRGPIPFAISPQLSTQACFVRLSALLCSLLSTGFLFKRIGLKPRRISSLLALAFARQSGQQTMDKFHVFPALHGSSSCSPR